MEAPLYASIPTASVHEPSEPSRVSIDPARVAALADDIAVHGLLQPIGVAGPDPDGAYELGFGQRRLAAHRLLDRAQIPACVWPPGTPLLAMRASENHLREQLTPIEEALEIHRFMESGDSHSAIARRYRRGVEWVNARLDLLTLPEELQDAVHHGELAVSVANLLREVEHERYRASLVREAIDRGASAATVRVWVAHYAADRARIETNHETVEQIAASRGAYVVRYVCEGCRVEAPMADTSAIRLCRACTAQVLAAFAGEAPAPS